MAVVLLCGLAAACRGANSTAPGNKSGPPAGTAATVVAPPSSTTTPDTGQVRSATGAVGGIADDRIGPPGDGQPVRTPLAAGQCYDDLLDPSTDPPGRALQGAPCEQPHDAEVFLSTLMPEPPGTPYAGDQATSREVVQACLAHFTGYVGAEYGVSSLRLSTMRPSSTTWAAGDRGVVCALYDGKLRPLVGSVRGSGR